jgi:hypothetical protein
MMSSRDHIHTSCSIQPRRHIDMSSIKTHQCILAVTVYICATQFNLIDILIHLDEHHGGLSLKDPLQVPDEPITRSRAKKIKEAMQGLVQFTWAKFANLSNKTPTFKIGLKEEELALIHVIQAIEGGGIA